ncbi:winged helix-turn-helix transcriptional regulator [Gammaproteobacteria bacterium]|nr:winged helix-turn-helix transcriptional regulator [Gammaproteobacteria bacterium]
MKCENLDISKPLKLVGGKWKIAIIYVLSSRPVRFGEMKRILTPITQQMLTKQLRSMEQDNLINRKVYDVVPPKVEYSLTDFGRSFEPVLKELCKWDCDKKI